MLARKRAHPKSMSRKPRYIGFLVTRYTPEHTKTAVDSGFVGFTVVLTRRNAITPREVTTAPATASAIAIGTPPGSATTPAGNNRETIHMSAEERSTTAAGGIFNSRDFKGDSAPYASAPRDPNRRRRLSVSGCARPPTHPRSHQTPGRNPAASAGRRGSR